jgi:hypothetical protein
MIETLQRALGGNSISNNAVLRTCSFASIPSICWLKTSFPYPWACLSAPTKAYLPLGRDFRRFFSSSMMRSSRLSAYEGETKNIKKRREKAHTAGDYGIDVMINHDTEKKMRLIS